MNTQCVANTLFAHGSTLLDIDQQQPAAQPAMAMATKPGRRLSRRSIRSLSALALIDCSAPSPYCSWADSYRCKATKAPLPPRDEPSGPQLVRHKRICCWDHLAREHSARLRLRLLMHEIMGATDIRTVRACTCWARLLRKQLLAAVQCSHRSGCCTSLVTLTTCVHLCRTCLQTRSTGRRALDPTPSRSLAATTSPAPSWSPCELRAHAGVRFEAPGSGRAQKQARAFCSRRRLLNNFGLTRVWSRQTSWSVLCHGGAGP